MKRIALLTSFLPYPFSFKANSTVEELYKYCGENSGNIAFVHAVQQHFKNPVTFFPWTFNPEELRQKADIIVIPCANQVGAHGNIGWAAEPLEKAGLPVVAIGLGAQAPSTEASTEIPDGTRRWLQTIRKLRAAPDAINISVRGVYSRSQLEKASISALPLGCPSLFISHNPSLGEEIARHWQQMPRRVCMAGGHYKWEHMTHVEQQLVQLVNDTVYPGAYLAQSTIENLRITKDEFDLIEPGVLERIRLSMLPHYPMEAFRQWCRTYAHSYYDGEGWMAFAKRYDLTIGARYHAAALAMQAGKMGVTIAIDSRTEELATTTGVPFFRARELDWPVTRASLHKRIRFSAADFDNNRRQLCRQYVNFLRANTLEPAAFLEQIAATAP